MSRSSSGTHLSGSKKAASVRLGNSAKQQKAYTGVRANGSVSGTRVTAKDDDKSNPIPVLPVDVQALLRDGRSQNAEHHLCSTCRPIFFHILGVYEAHPLYDSSQKNKREIEQGYSCKSRSAQEICTSAFKGCDACRLVLFLIADAPPSSYYKGRRVAPRDQIKVHLRRWKNNEYRTLCITHYGEAGTAFDDVVFLEMGAERENPASKYVRGVVDFNGTESLQVLELANGWLKECSTSRSHLHCHSADTRLPSRVLDVRNGLKLLETKNLFRKYAALSYCWGGDQPNMLLTTNQSEYMSKICEADQPKTIRDAVKVTRAIGLDFLWVDSYCIIQDSAEDKDKEIQYMAQIYQNSFITIAAASAPSVHHGFLKSSSNLELMPLQVSLPDRSIGTIWLERTIIPKYDKEPIEKRAWTLQEGALSRRLLFFRSKFRDLEFQCKTLGRYNMTAMNERGGGVDLWHLSPFPPLEKSGSRHFLWAEVVDEYTRRAVSVPTDKLTALAGVASHFSTYLGPTYLAGMWERNLVSQLLWYTRSAQSGEEGFARLPEVYIAPSWSWASLNGPIGASYLEQTESDPIGADQYRLKILGSNQELAVKAAPFGAVNSVDLIVRGWLMRARVTYSTSSLLLPEDYKRENFADLELQPWDLWELQTPNATALGSAVLDIVKGTEAAEVYCLLVAKIYSDFWKVFEIIRNHTERNLEHWVLGGLLLVHDNTPGTLPGTYRRVGLFHIDPDYDECFMRAAKRTTLRLV